MSHDHGQPPATASRPPELQRAVQRVLVLASWFPDQHQPGLGSFVVDQIHALQRCSRVDVRVLAARPTRVDTLRPWAMLRDLRQVAAARRRASWREHAGIPVLDVPFAAGAPLPVVSNAHACARAIAAVAGMVRAQFTFDLVHAHTTYLDGSAALVLARRYGVPCVVTEHTGPFGELMRRPWIRRTIRRTLRGVDQTLAVSEALAREMRRWLPPAEAQRLRVLRNGVDPELFVPPRDWRPDPANPRLVAIGAFRPVKDPETLLAAFAAFRRTCPGASLHLVGDDDRAAAVRARCGELGLAGAVRFHGHLDRPAVAALLRDECDVLVISSRSETFGLAAVEALACGKPVVSTRCGGPEEIVDDPALGRLCPVGDPAAMAAALRAVCAGLSSCEPQALRRSAVRRFALDDVARDLQRIYDEVHAARGRGRT